jgi:hypothetical protein
MTQIMTITSKATKTVATATDEKYSYKVDYNVSESGNKIENLTVYVEDKTGEYLGQMTLNGVQKNIVVPETTDLIAVGTMFDGIISEIKSNLTV